MSNNALHVNVTIPLIDAHMDGLLPPLEIPDNRWQSIAIDFITGLPKSNGIDAIVTVTDRLTKMVHILPTTSNATASDIASLFFGKSYDFTGF